MNDYKILINQITSNKIREYKNSILEKRKKPGKYLTLNLKEIDLSNTSFEDFTELLLNTKVPQIFAESQVMGDGSDWNLDELSILGDISIAVPVKVFDNALHVKPMLHSIPLDSVLIYTPGALLENMRNQTPADWDEVVLNDHINQKAFYSLYERRLLPPFLYMNETCKQLKKQAIITIPGLGCGQFAGKFRGTLGNHLKEFLSFFLSKYVREFSNIKVVYYDPYNECSNERVEIQHLVFLTRPLTQGNENKPQLCYPVVYQDKGDNFSDLKHFSIVAWDHVSWAGNDFYIGSRVTDDGVKSASTNSMEILTGFKGTYNAEEFKYLPPNPYQNWREVILKNNLKIDVNQTIYNSSKFL
ncbi:MAG: hypothetical protein O9264_16255 [Leptospira sp.]|nr:hypothetical protein [Leptospira sp.]